MTVLPIYIRTALHDLNFGYLVQKRYKICEFEYTGIPTKTVKKKDNLPCSISSTEFPFKS